MNKEHDDIKVILLGDVNVGKTSIYIRFFESTWNRKYHQNTIGMVYKKTNMTYKNESYSLGVWDTAGSERYVALTNMYYRNADYAILCYDPSSLNSWNRVLFWHDELKKHAERCEICVCATKKDLIDSNEIECAVEQGEVEKFVKSINGFYMHVSSKTGENINELFYNIVKILADNDKKKVYIEANRVQNSFNRRNIQLVEKIVKQDKTYCC